MDNRILFFKAMADKANTRGSYSLEESYILKTCFDNFGADQQKNVEYINVVIQFLQKGQSHGSFNLEESSRIFTTIKDLQSNSSITSSATPTETQASLDTTPQPPIQNDVSDLTEPLPL